MAALADLQLTEGEKLVLDRLRAGPATLGELCRELLVAAWEVCEAVHGFLLLEIVERTPSVPAGGNELDAGRLDQRSLPELLIALHVSRRTGMLPSTGSSGSWVTSAASNDAVARPQS